MNTSTQNPVIDRPQAANLAINGGKKIAETNVGMIAVKLSEEEINAAVEVMRSGMLAMGKHVAEFEAKFAEMTGAKHALACANGTCALQLAYGATIEPGDEVLCPAWTYIATASMLVAAGAKVVWVDADPNTYTINIDDLRKKVTENTVAIACTHLYGNPVNIAEIESIAAENGLSVIYDAAQSHMATYNGKGLGAYGDCVTYSFYPTKNMTTGEGGMVTTNDDEIANKIKMLRSHGETAKYEHSYIGFNYRMTDVEGAVGCKQLDSIQQVTDRRRANAAALTDALATIDGLHAPTETDNATHAFHLYPIRIDPDAFMTPEGGENIRDLFCKALNAEGIGTAIHYPRSLTRQPVFDLPGVEHQPVADSLSQRLFCVPVHQHLTEQQVAQVGQALKKVADALHR
ncbi:MAG: DegT/DnrJ/EryC1/StrS family aminotransferase [Phycisphaerales bacterium JB050]